MACRQIIKQEEVEGMNTLIIFGTEVGLSALISLCIIFYL